MHVNEIRNNNVHCCFYLCDCKLLTCLFKNNVKYTILMEENFLLLIFCFIYCEQNLHICLFVTVQLHCRWWNALLRGSLLVVFQWQTHVSHIQLASQCSPQSPANLCVLKGVMELWARLRGAGDDGRAADGSRLWWCVSQPPSKWRLDPEILS